MHKHAVPAVRTAVPQSNTGRKVVRTIGVVEAWDRCISDIHRRRDSEVRKWKASGKSVINLEHDKDENVVKYHAGPENLQRNQSFCTFWAMEKGPKTGHI